MTHEERCGINSLEVIYTEYGAVSEHVVRWCPKCGAVVVDEDFDGRTNPGAVLKMRFPHMSRPEPTAVAQGDGDPGENKHERDIQPRIKHQDQ